MTTVYKRRYENLLKKMETKECGGLALCTSPNLFYITGYAPKVDERFQVLFVSLKHPPILVVPKLYQDEAEKNCWVEEQIIVNDGDNIEFLMASLMERMKISGSLFALDETMQINKAYPILKNHPQERIIVADEIFSELRVIKDEYEINMLEESGKICDEVMDLACKYCRPNISEVEIKDYVEQEFKKRNVRDCYSNLIASGENTSLPHHSTGNRLLEHGDVVYFDIGGTYNKYWSDCTRTFYIGEPPKGFLDTYQIVKNAQQKAREKIKPGITAEELYFTAYNELEEMNLGKYFIHRLGHGLGLEGHENLSINKGNKIELREGMVFSIEPGVYFKGKYGIRIEDTVLVTKYGHKSFNKFNRELILL